ncbi:MAG: hypothetical protein IT343_17555 [Candidatus Melainabacteria bacterium]|jgi:hypothetical protein|nr:hypothetical protein [Candidatus Melainabacteria bacterium]
MRHLAIALAFVGSLIAFTATPASAQSVGVHIGRDGVGVHVGDGYRDRGYYGRRDGCYDNRNRCNDRWDGRRGDRRWDDRRWDDRRWDRGPANITVTVWEYRQVQTRWGWENVRVRATYVAYWDHSARAYVYRGRDGRRHYVDGYGY